MRLTNGQIESIETKKCENKKKPKLILRNYTKRFSQTLGVHYKQ